MDAQRREGRESYGDVPRETTARGRSLAKPDAACVVASRYTGNNPQPLALCMSEISIPVSFGELIDKLTILEIKALRMVDATQLTNVGIELHKLNATWNIAAATRIDITAQRARLKAVNEKLWDIEDHIRRKEKAQAFDAEFIALARSVYFENDQRAAIKREINQLLGSTLIEEKSYAAYRSP